MMLFLPSTTKKMTTPTPSQAGLTATENELWLLSLTGAQKQIHFQKST